MGGKSKGGRKVEDEMIRNSVLIDNCKMKKRRLKEITVVMMKY
jgi:hypothetical protein